jgi:hypothetical protein
LVVIQITRADGGERSEPVVISASRYLPHL